MKRGFEYSDCWVEDSRLVVLCAMDARDRGAEVLTRTECVALERHPSHWRATLRNADGTTRIVEARALANAAGPWVDAVAGNALGAGTPARLRLVKGSHIIVPRKYPGEHAYIFQNGDGRVVFAIPYERDFTLVGTTDQLFEGDLDTVRISREERAYLREAAGEYFKSGISDNEIVSTYAGVRPLYDDNAARNSTVTRDYVFELEAQDGAPILSVYGGKITTFRKLAEHALGKLASHLAMGPKWTRAAPLPGGEMADFAVFLRRAGERYAWIPPEMLLRLARAYGTRIDRVIGTADGLDRLGDHFGGDLYEAELRYLVAEEFARTPQDILWRRSKLGLHLPAETERRVADWLDKQGGDCA